MYYHKEFGEIFEIGDRVKYKGRFISRYRNGVVIESFEPTHEEPGYYKIIFDGNQEIIDCHYFLFDAEFVT